MRGYGQFCPVTKAAEVFAERWTPLILRELLYGSHHFGELQRGIPRLSQRLLAQRLRSLERGEELGQVVELLGGWGYRWAVARLTEADLDPAALMWVVHRLIDPARLPERRVVVRVELRDDPRRAWWLVMKRPDVDLCLRDEGFEVDLVVRADTATLAQVCLGRRDLRQAIRQGLVELEGSTEAQRGFPERLGTTPFARFGDPATVERLRPVGIRWPGLADSAEARRDARLASGDAWGARAP